MARLIWQDGSITELAPLPGDDESFADGINDRGDAVGWSHDTASASFPHAVLWHDGTITDLGVLPGDSLSEASGINNRGQVVGVSENPGVAYHAFLWENGRMTQLPDLSGGLGGSTANGINDRGQIAGYSASSPTGGYHAVVWRVVGGQGR